MKKFKIPTASILAEILQAIRNAIAKGIVFSMTEKMFLLLCHTISNQTPTISTSTIKDTSI